MNSSFVFGLTTVATERGGGRHCVLGRGSRALPKHDPTKGSPPTQALRTLAVSLLAVLSAACSPFVFLNATIPHDGYAVASDLAYGTLPRHRLDVYTPAQAATARTVVLFYYGGSWKRGERANYRFVGQAMTSRGFVAVIPDYRTYPEGRFPDFVEDAAKALHWVRTHIRDYGGDPARIYLLGHSAGAHIAALLSLDPSYLSNAGLNTCSIRGTIGLAGPYAFHPLDYQSLRPVFGHLEDPEMARPIAFAGREAPAMLLLHGARDKTVRPGNSEQLAQRLRTAGSPVRYVAYEGMGHVGIILALAAGYRERAPVLDDIAGFLSPTAMVDDSHAVRCQGDEWRQRSSAVGDTSRP